MKYTTNFCNIIYKVSNLIISKAPKFFNISVYTPHEIWKQRKPKSKPTKVNIKYLWEDIMGSSSIELHGFLTPAQNMGNLHSTNFDACTQ